MCVAQIKTRGVDQRTIAVFGSDFKTPQRRFRKSVFHGAALVGIVAIGAKGVIRSRQQHAWPGSFKTHDVAIAELAAIQTDIVRSDSRRK